MNAELVGVYFKQLSAGCGVEECENEVCNKFQPADQKQAVAAAIVLAARGPQKLCFFETLAAFETMAETATMCHDAGIPDAFEEMCSQVEDVFSSATHIPSQLAPVSAKMLDVNFVARIFQLIVSAHESVAKAFSQALSKLLSHFGSGSLAPANNNSLRVRLTAVISLAFGALMDPSNFSTVVQPLCSEISRYSDEDRKLFVSIWQKVDKQGKQHIAQALHQYITLEYYTLEVPASASATDRLYQHLRAPVACLSVLYRANFGVEAEKLFPKSASSESSPLGGGGSSKSSVEGSEEAATATSANGSSPGSEEGAKSPATAVVAAATPESSELARQAALTPKEPDLPQDVFYSDVLNLEMSLELDLQRWLDGEGSLCDYPCVLTAASKARILQADAALHMRSSARRAFMDHSRSAYLVLQVSRENIVEDCLQQLAPKSAVDLKKKLKVKFRGEDGIDEGGLAKEFFQVIMGQLFDRTFAMFNYFQDDRVYWFNANTFEMPVKFELIGNLMGIALFNGVILNLHFPGALYKKLLDYPTTLRDLHDLMPDVAENLQRMLSYDEEGLEDIEAYFEYNYEYYGSVKSVDLKPGGSSIRVTTANVAEYVTLLTDYLLNTSVAKQFNALKRGFIHVTQGKTLKLFTPFELERAICGCQTYDFYQLERTTRYEDGFDKHHKVIKNFWAVLHELSLEQQKKVLMFATGSDRAPVEGLQGVNLVISRMGGDVKSLPTSHTCFNHLLLPEYPDKRALKTALLLAINHATGFGLR
eukprot:INCI15427.1.p1 GENE.INCI15427.1~~INCI15427.1.p1  ORF type:complete len:763 (-),score=141.67 INCI15427.1:1081-3369(-)